MTKKLGKLAPKYNTKALMLSKYLTSSIPAPPAKVYREYKIPERLWGMDANDRLGDCTCACIAHMLMLMTVHTGPMVTPTVDEVIKTYTAVSGYDPATGANDNGAYISDVLDYWQKTGISNHKILGWAKIDHTNIEEVKQAIWIFGGIDIGVQVPNSCMNQFDRHEAWDVVNPDGGIEGGHSNPVFAYGHDGNTCVTWGKWQQINWAWFEKYCDEAYAVISDDWIIQATHKTMSGFDLTTLKADLAKLRH
jgi:hypothetical protein